MRKMIPFLLSVAVSVCLVSDAFAQIAGGDFHSKIASSDRDELAKSLALYVQYQSEKKWDKLYDLLQEQRDRTTFVRDQEKRPGDVNLQLLDFTSLSAVLPISTDPNWVIVEGCATVRKEGGKEVRYKAITNAYKVKAKWIFTMIEFPRPVGSKPIKCSLPTK